MKIRQVLLLMLCGCGLLFAEGRECTLNLLNGDQIEGRYLGQEGEWVLLDSFTQGKVLRVRGKYVSRVDFGMSAETVEAEYIFRLSGGGVIAGDIQEYNGEVFSVKTAWADELNLDSQYVLEVQRLEEKGKLIYRASGQPEEWVYERVRSNRARVPERNIPRDAQGWVMRGQGWLACTLPRLQHGAGVRVQLVIPPLDFRDSFSISLENLPGSRDLGKQVQEHVQIQVNQRMLSVAEVPILVNRGMVLGQQRQNRAVIPRPNPGVVDLLIEVDPQQRRYRVKLDEKVIAEWSPEDQVDTSAAYAPRFSLQWNLNSSVAHLRDLRVYERSISLPKETLPVPEGTEAVVFGNGDVLRVHWTGVDEQGNWKLMLADHGTETSMAPERIQLWANHAEGLRRIRRIAPHVQLQLAGGEASFIAELLGADSEYLRVTREGWEGEQRIPMNVVEKISFNPYFAGP